jgi:Ser/Thr protein kinase RdoA (MazF antagonist)
MLQRSRDRRRAPTGHSLVDCAGHCQPTAHPGRGGGDSGSHDPLAPPCTWNPLPGEERRLTRRRLAARPFPGASDRARTPRCYTSRRAPICRRSKRDVATSRDGILALSGPVGTTASTGAGSPGACALADDVRAALAQHGFAPCRAALLSPLGDRKGRRCAYRVETEDGRVVKARLFESPEEARRVLALRAGLEGAFAPALARLGAAVLEEWIDGVPLLELDWEAWVEPAGALLGRLHARPLPPDAPATSPTRPWIESATSDLEMLGATGRLASTEVERLRAAIRERDPGASRTALAHLDFCADNMVIDVHGWLRVIDNEMLAVRPPGFDLARTFLLWPMAPDAWARFRRGYRSAAPIEPEAAAFWRLVATLQGARIFLSLSPTRAAACVALLRRLLAGGQPADDDR